jgi:hypothetical protein
MRCTKRHEIAFVAHALVNLEHQGNELGNVRILQLFQAQVRVDRLVTFVAFLNSQTWLVAVNLNCRVSS